VKAFLHRNTRRPKALNPSVPANRRRTGPGNGRTNGIGWAPAPADTEAATAVTTCGGRGDGKEKRLELPTRRRRWPDRHRSISQSGWPPLVPQPRRKHALGLPPIRRIASRPF